MSSKYIPLIELISDKEFIFDGVSYYNAKAKTLYERGFFNNLISFSRIVSGTPHKNDYSYLFKTESGNWVLTTNKRWNAERTVEAYAGFRFDLLLIQKTLDKFAEY